jgi:hypothetical protein
MPNCPVCQEALNESIYTADKLNKSCPKCSEAAGRHVYRPLADFGVRVVHGREYIQSHCAGCRTPPDRLNASPPSFTC